MKIVSNLLENIEGIRIYYIIGLLIFVILFIVIFIRTMKRSNTEMEDIKNSILHDNTTEKTLHHN
ncbi:MULTISPECIES: cbb3-type cytochrome c oxidase subunit 3 [Maribellus]|uniref:CcoQ/FixQ family Cbb3-type cytochrome c oxidase assembly chaperone n=1 Tax=Maribellus comscasis TaxID=2681766 RepID=A0A6I6JV40_9BACT|nr:MULTISPECIES: cbb3-type cytochrome c oxidase subunit 3 [Maribellus]MCG6186585.1 cbb3-type cytochrome c oxidase subunit 3 [Maribellus maritimus]QGY43233.1 CcoQ/FixQ family Cbb3-type cytochrome c oxidase assembly chaperone [Maribellus comscasis]